MHVICTAVMKFISIAFLLPWRYKRTASKYPENVVMVDVQILYICDTFGMARILSWCCQTILIWQSVDEVHQLYRRITLTWYTVLVYGTSPKSKSVIRPCFYSSHVGEAIYAALCLYPSLSLHCISRLTWNNRAGRITSRLFWSVANKGNT